MVSDIEMASELNRYFASVFQEPDEKSPLPNIEQLDCERRFDMVAFDETKIRKAIESLKNDTAPGPDGISAHVLKNLNGELADPIAIILNKTISSDAIPRIWKCSNVSAIFKKGSRSDVSNYRPVSMKSLLCKLGEKVIKNELLDFLINNNMIKASQHGFMPGRSTTTNLIEYLDKITTALDEGLTVCSVYTDFSKCFDRIPHRLIIHKLKTRYNVDGAVLSWIRDWLSDRQQRVVLNGETSEWIDVTSGVIQGSVLGPILALMMLDSIDDELDYCQISKYADDNKLFAMVRNDEDRRRVQCDLAGGDHLRMQHPIDFVIP